jgi:energy-coupling factor transport system ATP-binding protein
LVVKIGCIFQNPSGQFFNIDAESEIAFGCENLGISREEIHRRVSETAGTLGITHLLNRSVISLSGGEKQMIAIASVYAMGVDVFLMDEPSANLDKTAVTQLERMIGILKNEGKTIIQLFRPATLIPLNRGRRQHYI